jgi:hypothetical protein
MKYAYTVTVILTNPFRQVRYYKVYARDATEAIQRGKSMCKNMELVREGQWSAHAYADEDPTEL